MPKTSQDVFVPKPDGRKELYLSLMGRIASGKNVDKKIPIPPALTSEEAYLREILRGMIYRGFGQSDINKDEIGPIIDDTINKMITEGKMDVITPDEKDKLNSIDINADNNLVVNGQEMKTLNATQEKDLDNINQYMVVTLDTLNNLESVKIGDVTLAVDQTTGKISLNGETPLMSSDAAGDIDFDGWI